MLACLLVAAASCSKKQAGIESARFSPGSVTVELSEEAPISRVEVLDEKGARAARAVFSKGYRDRRITINFDWKEKHEYLVRIRTANDAELTYKAMSPAHEKKSFYAFQFPFGMDTRRVAVPVDTEITGSISVANTKDEPRTLTVAVTFPEGFATTENSDADMCGEKSGRVQCRMRVSLANKYDSKLIPVIVKSPAREAADYENIEMQVIEHGVPLHTEIIQIRAVKPEALAEKIFVDSVALPTNDKGEPDERLTRDALHLSTVTRLRAMLTGEKYQEANFKQVPFSFFRVAVKNTLDEDAIILVKAWIVDTKTGEKVEAFTPDPHVNPLGEVFTTTVLKSGAARGVTLPIYVEPVSVLEGDYKLVLSLTQMGAEKPFSVRGHNFTVTRQAVLPFVITLAGAVLAGIFLVVLFIRFRRIMSGFKVKWIVLISLYGSVGFVIVNVPGTLFMDVFRALLGPFSFLASGLFFGVVQYVLWTSLIMLVPRAGTMSLVMAVRMLLSWVLLGNISLVSVLWMAVHALTAEAALWLLGATRGSAQNTVRPTGLFIAFAVSEAVATFFNLESVIFLYRLYYADWYIVLNTLIGGVGYTLIGVALGLGMGKRLRMVVE